MNNQYITVNLIPNLSAPAVACVSQYDVGRPLVFRVYNGVTSADLTSVTAVAVGTKKSGLGFSVTGTISGNTVTFNSTLEMTQESGMIPAEIRFSKTGENIGTANFTLAVEPSPHLEGTTDGTTETMEDLQSQLDALDERVEALETGGGGLTDSIKSALLQIAQKVAYIDEYGQTYYNALYNALYPPADLVSISAVYTQSGTVYDTDSLDSLKAGLVVTANYAGGTSETVPASDYTLSGTLTEGTSTITVEYGGLTDTFDVTVTHQSSGRSDETDWSDGVAYEYEYVPNTYIDNTDGSVDTYNNWSSTPKLYCNGASSLTFTAVTASSAADANSLKYNAFYDANGGFVSAFQIGDMQALGTTSTITVPSTAVYFAVSSKMAVFRMNSQYSPYVTITPNA